MNRRTFIAVSGTAGLCSLAANESVAAQAETGGRQYLELQKYTFESEAQRGAFDAFLKDALIPAVNRLGSRPVGVFCDAKEPSPLYVLLPHATLEAAASRQERLLADAEFGAKAAAVLDAPKSALPFKEVDNTLMLAFKGVPTVQTPVKSPGRVFQLRIYESPSLLTARKKIEMFNDGGELAIFREVGLAPVFFGETLFGAKMPNLTYMVGFEDAEQQKAAWGKFGKHPEWQKLRAMPEYADARIIRAITNIVLVPAAYSQV